MKRFVLMSFVVVGTETTFLILCKNTFQSSSEVNTRLRPSELNKLSVPELLSFTTKFPLTVNLPPQQLSEEQKKKKLFREENGCNFGR